MSSFWFTCWSKYDAPRQTSLNVECPCAASELVQWQWLPFRLSHNHRHHGWGDILSLSCDNLPVEKSISRHMGSLFTAGKRTGSSLRIAAFDKVWAEGESFKVTPWLPRAKLHSSNKGITWLASNIFITLTCIKSMFCPLIPFLWLPTMTRS